MRGVTLEREVHKGIMREWHERSDTREGGA